MTKWFNTAGPCKANIHYLVPPSQRLPNLVRLIAQENYFVIHAPRQTGKTTAMLTLAQELTQQGTYAAVLLSVEVGAAFPQDLGMAEAAILADWRQTAEFWLPPDLQPPPWPPSAPGQQIGAALRLWAKACPRPLVVFIDEVDALRNATLIALLRQLRSGLCSTSAGFSPEYRPDWHARCARLQGGGGGQRSPLQRPDLPPLEERTTASVVTSPGGRRVTVIRG